MKFKFKFIRKFPLVQAWGKQGINLKLKVAILALLIGGGLLLFKTYSNTSANIVTFTEDGFFPKELTVEKGSAVIFRNDTQKSFWPASNLHPTHDIYKEFDSQEQLAPNASWSFTFEKVGDWKYHDHLRPLYIGLVRVIEKGGKSSFMKTQENTDCSKQPISVQQQCFEDVTKQIIRTQGLDKGFNYLQEMYIKESIFASNCHSYTHVLGREAYALFRRGKEVVSNKAMSYCEYGFYHGFVEGILTATKDYKLARSFCEREMKNVKLAIDQVADCYHGIGHGLLDPKDKRIIFDTDNWIVESLGKCEELTTNQIYLNRCSHGIYNVIATAYLYDEYEERVQSIGPLSICNTQDKSNLKRECFAAMSFILLKFSGDDFMKALTEANKIPEEEYREIAVYSIAEFIAYQNIHLKDFASLAQSCERAPDRIITLCVQGVARGIIKFDRFGKKEDNALKFCTDSGLTHMLEKSCLKHLVEYTENYLEKSKHHQLCARINDTYEISCNDN